MNLKLNFSGHETFPLRQLWLYKAHELIKLYEKPFTKDAEKSIAHFGIGKNMLKSIGYWIQATQLYKSDNKGEFTPSHFGKNLFDENFGDPYLERIESLWLLHIHLCTNKTKNSCLYWIFNINNLPDFNYNDFKRGIHRWNELECGGVNTIGKDSTLEKDFKLSLNLYCPRESKVDFEDIVHFPFWTLGLIKQTKGIRQNFEKIRHNLTDIPKSIFYYSFLRYLNLRKNVETISFDDLLNDRESPGRVLLLNEHPLRIYLEGLEKDLNGAYIFDDTAGQKLVYKHYDLDPDTYLEKTIYS
jgi:hypothetical protein